jgi:hypothetical protein
MSAPMTPDQADAVYDLLVEHCGASDESGPLGSTSRDMFVFHQTREVQREYRFQGGLGFGGKFRRNGWEDRWYVDCYPEDLTPERQQMIDAANTALAELKEKVCP